MNRFNNNTRIKSCNFRRSEAMCMRKIVPLISLSLFILLNAGCYSSTSIKDNNSSARNPPSEETVSLSKGSGYLSSGPTVVIDTGEGKNKRTSLLEQFDQLKKDLAISLKTNESLEKELENEKTIKVLIESELEEFKKQTEATQQLIIENEKICKKLEESQMPYERKIRELTFELTKAQIETIKAKQELLSKKIEQLVERNKQKLSLLND